MDYTIVGGGIAAFSAAKAIGDYDPIGRITVISEEEHCFYYRPMTPLLVKGDKERDDLLFAEEPPEFHTIHDRAVALDASERTVTLGSGDRLGFDRLLIATGSSPVVPDIPGIGEQNVHYLRTLKDAQDLKDAAKQGQKAVILGGGLVGIKKAVALRHVGLDVTVVEQLDHILLPRLDREGAEMITDILEKEGIQIITKATITQIMPAGKGVQLSDGSALACDMVCVAVGVTPNIGWLRDSGLAMDAALIVDERMETSATGIFAAGDVVQTTDCVTGKTMVSALWTNAVEMGKVAGANMAGGKVKYPGGLEIFNATEIERIAMVSVGDIMAVTPGNETVSRKRNGTYRKLVFKDDALTGAVFVGAVERAGLYTALIKTGVSLGQLKPKLLDGTLSYLDYARSHH